MSPCRAPLPLDTLRAYWAGAVPSATAEEVEEHLFGCAECSGALAAVAALAGPVEAVVRAGRVRLLLTPALLARLERDGVALRHFRVEPGGQAPCTAAPADSLLVSRLHGDFRPDERVDLVFLDAAGTVAERLQDLPVDRERGTVAFADRADLVRAAPVPVLVMRLYGVREGGERLIGEYTLVHTSWPD